jgi:uncharacterized protein YmfQ (DUF2313 family)
MTDKHVRRSGDDYVDALAALLPTGPAWPREYDSTLMALLGGLCQIWGFVDSRAADLLETESDPRTTVELLPDWERAWGLPDPCVKAPQGIDARRLALLVKMTMLGGQSREFFEAVAEALGYSITITEYLPYMCGVSFCGDSRGPVNNPDSPSEYLWQLGPPEIRFYWTVHVTGLRTTYFHTGSGECGVDRLLAIGTAEDLECILDRWKPAHTEIVFDYSDVGGLDFSQTYNTSYLALGIT